MTDKEKLNRVITEIKRLQQKVINGATSGQYSSETIREKNQLLVSLISFIDSMQEEPVNEDFEEAANNALNNVLNNHEIVNVRSCLEMFKLGVEWKEKEMQSTIELAEDHAMFAGMNKMEQQMMAKAINAKCFGFQGAALFSFRLPADNYLVGSEVKVIVIKDN